MVSSICDTARGYYTFYGTYFAEQWYHLTPIKYGLLLISVGVFGWCLMKASNKRA